MTFMSCPRQFRSRTAACQVLIESKASWVLSADFFQRAEKSLKDAAQDLCSRLIVLHRLIEHLPELPEEVEDSEANTACEQAPTIRREPAVAVLP